MRPGPLPPLLAALNAALEAHAELTEEGVLIVEQDRRPIDHARPAGARPSAPPALAPLASAPPLLPVIVFIPAKPRPGAASGRVAPELIAEVQSPASEKRRETYAKAGVREYWRVDPGPVIVIHDQAEAGAWKRVRAFAGETPIESALFPKLVLRPADLERPAP